MGKVLEKDKREKELMKGHSLDSRNHTIDSNDHLKVEESGKDDLSTTSKQKSGSSRTFGKKKLSHFGVAAEDAASKAKGSVHFEQEKNKNRSVSLKKQSLINKFIANNQTSLIFS